MTAREEILLRVRSALADVPANEPSPLTPVVRDYRKRGRRTPEEVVALFAERCADYRARVHCVTPAELHATIDLVLGDWSAHRVAIPADVPPAWRVERVEWIEDHGMDHAALDAVDGVVTGCAIAIAETGTIALDSGARQGRRALTLIPDRHLCVVEAACVVELVPEAIERLGAPARAGRPITLIAGPSATSDIELERVEGVHGPRTLDVLVLAGG